MKSADLGGAVPDFLELEEQLVGVTSGRPQNSRPLSLRTVESRVWWASKVGRTSIIRTRSTASPYRLQCSPRPSQPTTLSTLVPDGRTGPWSVPAGGPPHDSDSHERRARRLACGECVKGLRPFQSAVGIGVFPIFTAASFSTGFITSSVEMMCVNYTLHILVPLAIGVPVR